MALGCGGASNNPTSPTTASSRGQNIGSQGQNIGFVEGNHPAPHEAVISAAQLSAGTGITLDISNGFHSHLVTLTGAEVMQIAAGARVYVNATTSTHSNGADNHAHGVTFN